MAANFKKWWTRKTVWAAVSAIVTCGANLLGLDDETTKQLLIIETAIAAIFMREAIEGTK